MRILIITETFVPSTDGVVTRLKEEVKYINRSGHTVAIVAPDLGQREYDGSKIYGIKTHKMPFYRNRAWGIPSTKVRDIILEFNPDVVHVANPVLIGLSGVKYSRELRVPLVVSYHTHLDKYLDYYHLDYAVVRKLLWDFERHLHNQADLNLCTSETMRKELIRQGIERVHVLKRGVDIDNRHPRFKSAAMRERLTDGHPEKPLLVFVGRLAAEKELDRLLPLMRQNKEIRLAIVGDGPYGERLRKNFAGTNTVFTGFLHGEALSQAYASADAFIFPSISETLGLVILEAMASGIPVIASKSGPTLEQVEDGKTGFLFDVEDAQSLFRAVERMKDTALMAEMCDNARKEAEANGWERTNQQMMDYYHLAIERARRVRRPAETMIM